MLPQHASQVHVGHSMCCMGQQSQHVFDETTFSVLFLESQIIVCRLRAIAMKNRNVPIF